MFFVFSEIFESLILEIDLLIGVAYCGCFIYFLFYILFIKEYFCKTKTDV